MFNVASLPTSMKIVQLARISGESSYSKIQLKFTLSWVFKKIKNIFKKYKK